VSESEYVCERELFKEFKELSFSAVSTWEIYTQYFFYIVREARQGPTPLVKTFSFF
jgi:hypothetical protein